MTNVREWTGAAATAEEAVQKGLRKLGLSREDADIKILGEKTSGLLSMFGFRRVEVSVAEKPGARRESARDEGRRGDRDDRPPRRDRDDRGRGRGPRQEDRGPRGGKGRDERPARPRGESPRAPHQDRGPRNDRPARDENRSRNERPYEDRPRHDRPREDRPRVEASREERPREESAGPRREPPSGQKMMTQWKELLGWDDLTWTAREGSRGDILVTFKTEKYADVLGGENGEVLEAFQYLFNTARSQGDRSVPRAIFTLEGHASPDEQRLIDEAKAAADEAKKTGEPVSLPPMDSRDRRLVHQALADHPDVETGSEGEGQDRRVVVRLKNRG